MHVLVVCLVWTDGWIDADPTQPHSLTPQFNVLYNKNRMISAPTDNRHREELLAVT
jgi:hypothetical protein